MRWQLLREEKALSLAEKPKVLSRSFSRKPREVRYTGQPRHSLPMGAHNRLLFTRPRKIGSFFRRFVARPYNNPPKKTHGMSGAAPRAATPAALPPAVLPPTPLYRLRCAASSSRASSSRSLEAAWKQPGTECAWKQQPGFECGGKCDAAATSCACRLLSSSRQKKSSTSDRSGGREVGCSPRCWRNCQVRGRRRDDVAAADSARRNNNSALPTKLLELSSWDFLPPSTP